MPTAWKVGEIDSDTGEWKKETSQNIKWAARLGSQTYPSPIVANGKVFIGTNNGSGYLKRAPASTDLGVLLCFNEADGKFLWQDSSEKLPATGRAQHQTGPCWASAARRWPKGIGCGTSPAAAK